METFFMTLPADPLGEKIASEAFQPDRQAGKPNLRRFRRQCLGWCVHFYTALGLVAAAAIAVLLVHSGAEAFRHAFLIMVAATLIDATDGTLARMVRIKEVLPGFDGRRLDDLVDFLTYTFLPLLLIWRAHLLPENGAILLLLPLLASIWLLSKCSQDGRWPFPRFPLVLERGGLLSVCLATFACELHAGRGDRLRAADVCAQPLSVSQPTRQTE